MDIRTLLQKLLAKDDEASCEAIALEKWRGDLAPCWRRNDGASFENQIHKMVLRITALFPEMRLDLCEKVAARIIDGFRVETGRPKMLESLANKTRPDNLIDAENASTQPPTNMEYSRTHEVLTRAQIEHLTTKKRRAGNEDSGNVTNIWQTHYTDLKRVYFTNSKLPFHEQIQLMLNRIKIHYTRSTYGEMWTAWAAQIIEKFREEDGCLRMLKVMENMDVSDTSLTGSFNQSQSPPEKAQTENTDTVNSEYSTIPIANPTLIFGKDIDKMPDGELIGLAKEIEGKIKDLREIPGRSKKIARQIKEHEAALGKVIEKLDAGESEEG